MEIDLQFTNFLLGQPSQGLRAGILEKGGN
jgi:hypothetical protein